MQIVKSKFAHYLIIEAAKLLGIPRELVEIHCESIYDLLLQSQNNTMVESDDEESDLDRKRKKSRNKIKKYVMIELASIGRGAEICVTGGMAAPIAASAYAGVLGAGIVGCIQDEEGILFIALLDKKPKFRFYNLHNFILKKNQ